MFICVRQSVLTEAYSQCIVLDMRTRELSLNDLMHDLMSLGSQRLYNY